MMKKVLSFGLVGMMALGMMGCGSQETTEATAEESTVIKIATSPDYAPYEYYDEAGNIVGFDIDALEAIKGYLAEEIPGVEFEWVPMDFSTIVSGVQTGVYDIGVSCFTYDPERDVLFSAPYLTSAQVMAVKADADYTDIMELDGEKIGAGTGTTGEAAVLELLTNSDVTSAGDYPLTFELLKNGGVQGVACDEAVAQNYVSTGEFKILDEKLVDEEVSIITSNKNQELMDSFNTAIAKFVESETYEELKAEHGLN